MSELNINGLTDQPPARAPEPSDASLKKACSEFEGMFMGMIMKQGLKTGTIDDEASASTDTLRDYIIEEVAQELGRTETFGIGKMLYEQIQGGRIAK